MAVILQDLHFTFFRYQVTQPLAERGGAEGTDAWHAPFPGRISSKRALLLRHAPTVY